MDYCIRLKTESSTRENERTRLGAHVLTKCAVYSSSVRHKVSSCRERGATVYDDNGGATSYPFTLSRWMLPSAGSCIHASSFLQRQNCCLGAVDGSLLCVCLFCACDPMSTSTTNRVRWFTQDSFRRMDGRYRRRRSTQSIQTFASVS